jgi:hypothetical protein
MPQIYYDCPHPKKPCLIGALLLSIPWMVSILINGPGAKKSWICSAFFWVPMLVFLVLDPETYVTSKGTLRNGREVTVKRSFIGLKRLEIVVDTGHEVTAQDGFRYERALTRV